MSSPICPPPPSIITNRQLGFIIWQSIAAASIHLTYSLFLRLLNLASLSFRDFSVSFVGFLLCLLLFSLSLLPLHSPFPHHSASPTELASTLIKSVLKSCIGGYSERLNGEVWARAERSLLAVSFSVLCVIIGFFSMVAACWGTDESFVGLGIRGAVFGLVFSAHYLYTKRWLLKFPVIQRPLFYSFKRGFKSSFPRALKLSIRTYLCSFLILLFLPNKYKINGTATTWARIISQINIFIGFFIVSYCWEISLHFLQVVHTRRCMFCPLQGSEQNPSDTLLEALEQSSPKSLLCHLTYLDLCMVSESNIESWRRAAFFEETGETYKRVVRACLRPIEDLVCKLSEDHLQMDLFSQQLMTQSFEESAYVKLSEAFDDFELCAWAARSLASLTARSRREDRYGVAQLSSSNISALTTLLSSLLAVESCLGKKTGIPDPSSFRSPQKFTTVMRTGKEKEKEKTVAIISGKRREELNNKAYAMADVLRTCIYQIVTAFRADMVENASALQKNWIQEGKPLFGSRDVLEQKLLQFVEYRAV
ncbi:hypothetical protein LUZ60_016672 [Juncus effusus]|nr:hypothetical protein LUZ60_016672 [Juncus effusus]